MDIVTIDFETYYDKEYSLSKMTTEAYIRDPRFEVIGVGIKVNNNETDWYSGSDPGGFLKSLDYTSRAILCHNTAFDGAILSWHFGVKPAYWLDTLSMARPLHASTVGGSLKALASYYELGEKGTEVVNALGKRKADFTPHELNAYAQYCCNDVELTYKLFRKLARGFPKTELDVIDLTLRMYTEPTVRLDGFLLRDYLRKLRTDKANMLSELVPESSHDTLISHLLSNNKFAALLQGLGVDPPTKTSARTGKETYAFSKTDLGFLALQEHPDERVQALVAARLGIKSTIAETRTESLIEVSKRGELPIMLNYYGAHTGRFSGGDKLNLQNLPARGDNTIRRSLRAPKGHVFVTCDSSQIEARMVAYIAGQDDLVQAFREERDVYCEFASEVYGRPVTKEDKVERFVGKTGILGLGYGLGHIKFRDTLKRGMGGISVDMEEHEAKTVVNIYRQKNHHIQSLWTYANHVLKQMMAGGSGDFARVLSFDSEGILLPNGMRIRYHGLAHDGTGFTYIADGRMHRRALTARMKGDNSRSEGDTLPGVTRIYGGKVVENATQALARIVVVDQMRMIAREGIRVAFQVHDENVCVVPEEQADEAKAVVQQIMSTPPEWAPDLPVDCEAGIGETYGDAK